MMESILLIVIAIIILIDIFLPKYLLKKTQDLNSLALLFTISIYAIMICVCGYIEVKDIGWNNIF